MIYERRFGGGDSGRVIHEKSVANGLNVKGRTGGRPRIPE